MSKKKGEPIMIRKEDVHKRLEKEFLEADARMKNWQSVKRLHKKDGGDFANIWKNFDKIYEGYNFSDSVEIKISGSYPNYNLASDSMIVKNEDLTPDGIEKAIKERIEYLKSKKEIIRDNRGVMDKLYDETMEKMLDVYSNIEEVAGNRTPLYYIMREAVENYFYPISLD